MADAMNRAIEVMADAIDEARYRHPERPRERIRPFSEADSSDREYAFRLARAAYAALPAVVPAGWKLVPENMTDEHADAALRATAVHLNIKGSALTVNREKMKARWRTALVHSPSPPQMPASVSWLHTKRGTTYVEVGRGMLQASTRQPAEDDIIVAYRGADGRLFFREQSEFEDGRFVRADKEPQHA